jgi:hypothetical protein
MSDLSDSRPAQANRLQKDKGFPLMNGHQPCRPVRILVRDGVPLNKRGKALLESLNSSGRVDTSTRPGMRQPDASEGRNNLATPPRNSLKCDEAGPESSTVAKAGALPER